MERCPICLESLGSENFIRELVCSHQFHVQCIDVWLTTYSALCPICKANHAKCGTDLQS
ncbi:hypothetical protein COEREDRAFT_46037 [Coemansia reversa NRRL 1564]|uniref:RING-type domain-containing protein n=1 Tax=Coemansia reversa (strain ATCC 12441 / NRRL 1564) TaxID=763665 RepID=A0A2G5B6Y6_COERN|nr:hypothetical protein COEREDRAFT_46037 [Coemansia reversa NRRL 1564]|eukprot:PIA14769.1 hypothetical protein COEREDRAFT_46037 [Coemansia reversa NRRL 1564]